MSHRPIRPQPDRALRPGLTEAGLSDCIANAIAAVPAGQLLLGVVGCLVSLTDGSQRGDRV